MLPVDVPVEAAPALTDLTSDAIEVLEPEDALGIGFGSDVLVVDDDPTNLVAYEAALAPLGRTLVFAQSGNQALAKLLERDFALILLDMSMPDISGLETARLIRQRPRCKATPIIFVTGMAWSTDVILEAYEAGAFDFVVKPVLPEILRAKASVYLALQDRTQKVLRQAAQLRDVNERLREAEHAKRDRDATASAAHRLAKLQEATSALSEAMTPADVARVTVRLGAEAVEASAATMWTVRPDGSLSLEASHGVPAAYIEHYRIIPADSPLPMIDILTRRQPIWVENETDYAREAPAAFELARSANRVWAFAALPLVIGGSAIAAITFSYEGQHTFTDEERVFLRTLAHTCEHALERARLYAVEMEARKAAEQLSERKDEFLAMLGHELRNPLAVMVTALDLIKFRDRTLSRELSILDRQVGHLSAIVDSLVTVSRITQGKITVQPHTTDLATVVAQVIETARPEIDIHRHQVTVSVPEHTLVHADAQRLEQALANLLGNAIKYTPDAGRIEISATHHESSVQITVRDNGRGIASDLLPNLFELFVQGERSLARSEGGLGIGLTLARTIVELHGGTITAHSDGPGTGSIFTLVWPTPTE